MSSATADGRLLLPRDARSEPEDAARVCVFIHTLCVSPLTLDTAPLWQTRQGSPGSSWAGWLLGGETLPRASAIIYPKSAASRHVAADRELQYFISLPVNQPCVGADGNIV